MLESGLNGLILHSTSASGVSHAVAGSLTKGTALQETVPENGAHTIGLTR